MTDDVITLRNHLRVGAQNALRRWQLCEMTGWTDRHLRKVIEAARCEEDGEEYCIMNFGKGYYLSNDPAEAVQDCKAVGIETLTPQQLDALKEDWRCTK